MNYDRWKGTGTSEAFVANVDHWNINQIRKNLNAAHARGSVGGFLGGSRESLFTASSETLAKSYWDVYLDWRHIDGKTVVARLEVYTANVGTSVTGRVKNLTDGVNHDTSAYSVVGWNEHVITLPTPGTLGVKKYRLYCFGSNTTNNIGVIGAIEVYDNLF